MFGEVWKWARTHRQTERYIGIDADRIPTEMPAIFRDMRYSVEHETYAALLARNSANAALPARVDSDMVAKHSDCRSALFLPAM